MDLQAARSAMIESQIRTSDITDRRLVAAMASIARETFLPADKLAVAYAEMAVQTDLERWMMAPRELARLIGVAEIKETDRVLDIAPGTGYSTAVLAKLAAEVVALEDSAELAGPLKANLAAAGAASVEIIVAPLKSGAPSKAPFDVILVNGAIEDVPQAWLGQLAEGGRLAVVVDEGLIRRARVYTRSGGKTAWRTPFESAAPRLAGFERAVEFRL